MSNNEEKSSKYKLEVPGEWALEKTLGPTLEQIGLDIAQLYKASKNGLAKIALATKAKIGDDASQKKANLRVSREVFWNAAFAESDICAEYFAGVLADSRSVDGTDDGGVFYLNIINSLSSSQLKLHYLIYSGLNRLLVEDPNNHEINVAFSDHISKAIFIKSEDLLRNGVKIDVDLNALYQKGLIAEFAYKDDMLTNKAHLTKVTPTTVGVQLFAVAANKLATYRNFSFEIFDNFKLNDAIPDTVFDPRYLFPELLDENDK